MLIFKIVSNTMTISFYMFSFLQDLVQLVHKTWWIGCNLENWGTIFPRFILTVCKLQPEILINIIKYPALIV